MADPLFKELETDPMQDEATMTSDESLSVLTPVVPTMPDFEMDAPPTQELPESMPQEDLEQIHTIPSIDIAGFFKGKRDPFAKLEFADASVYMGNFVSRYGERMRRWSATGGAEVLANALDFEAATMERGFTEIRPADTQVPLEGAEGFGTGTNPMNDPADLFSNRLRNLSFHLRTKAEEYLEERERQFPLPEGFSADKFFADATSSVLTSLGIVAATTAAATAAGVAAPAVGAVALATTAGSFGYMSFLEGFKGAQEAGASYEKSLAFSYVRAVGVSIAELAGLKSIFGKTYLKGTEIIGRRVLEAASQEGLTEGLQTVIELETDRQTGAMRNMSVMDYVSQVIYSSAVGAFAGGGMVASVAIPQKNRAMKALMDAGLDKNQAKEVYDRSMEDTLEMIDGDVRQDVGYDELQNMNDQRVFDIATSPQRYDIFKEYLGPQAFPAERMRQQLADNNATDRAQPYLNAVRTRAEADVRADVKQPATISGLAQADKAVVDTMRAETPKTGDQRPIFQVAEPEFAPDTEPAMRVAIKGRVQLLNEKMKPLAKEYAKVQKELAKLVAPFADMNPDLVPQAEKSKVATAEAKEAELFDQLMSMYSEAEALRKTPYLALLEGGDIKVKDKDIIQVSIGFARDIIKAAKSNFKKGRSTTQGEFQFIRTMLNRMVDQPGLSKDLRNQLRGRFVNKLTSKEAMMQNLELIESTIEEVRIETLSNSLLRGVDRLVQIMRKKAGEGRSGLGAVNLDAKSQALADIFVKEYTNKHTDPADIRTKIDGSPEVTMRWMASQLATRKNGVTGRDLLPLEIANMYSQLKEFVQQGRQAKLFEAEVNRRVKEQILADFEKAITNGQTGLDVSQTPTDVLDRVFGAMNVATGTYDSLLGLFERHTASLFGDSFARNMFSFNNAKRRAEILQAFYTSELQQAMVKAYPELEGDLKKIYTKNLEDAVREGGNSVHFSATLTNEAGQPLEDAAGVPQLKFFDFSRSEAREKLMLSYSPEGLTALRKEGFNDEALAKLDQSLSKNDKIFIQEQIRIYSDLYPLVNGVFRKIAGFDLPRRHNYSTIVTEEQFDEGDLGLSALYGDEGDFSSVQSKSYFRRITGKGELKTISDIVKLNRYIQDMAHYVGTAETVDRIQSVFKNKRIRGIIKAKFGEGTVRAVDRHIEVMIKNSVRTPNDKLLGPLSTLVTNMQRGFVASKAFNIIKQTTSMFAGIELVGVNNFFKYLKTLPKAWETGEIRDLTQTAYLHLRGTMNRSSNDLAQIERARTQGDEKTFLELLYGQKGKDMDANLKKYFENPTLMQIAFAPTQIGDFFGFMGSSWPVYQHYLAQGMSKAEAVARTIEFSNATQQSPDHTQMPAWALTANPLVRALFAFKQAPIQYFARVLRVMQTAGTKNFDPKKMAEVYALYFVFLPALFDAVSDLFRPDDDYRLGIGRRLMVGLGDELVIIGPMWDWAVTNALAGSIAQITGDKVEGKEFKGTEFAGVFSSLTKNIEDVNKALKKVLKEGISLPSMLKLVNEVTEATIPVTGTLGATARAGVNALEGLVLMGTESGGDIVKTWRRYFMAAGATRYATRPVEK